MDAMAYLILIATFIMVLVALSKSSKLDARIIQLKRQIDALTAEIGELRQGAPAAMPAAEPSVAAEAAEAEPSIVAAEEPTPADQAEIAAAANWATRVEAEAGDAAPPGEFKTAAPPPPRDMEQALASRWFVWIGGIAIAVGGLLFVKYAYDNALISPALQIVLGLLLGAGLVAAGEFVRRNSAVRPGDYVPAALSAAGLVTAFGSIYAAFALYELIGSTTTFVGLAAVALAALALSRLQGPLIAALGLIGSYGTPALIPSENPSAWSFFPYLLVILAASFATLRGRDWWWLGYSAIAGAAAWTGLWLQGGLFESADTLPVGLFLHALGLISFFGVRGWRMIAGEAKMQQPLFIGLAGFAAAALMLLTLVHKADHAALALLLFFAQAAILTAIAWAQPKLSPLAAAAAVLSFLVLMVWDDVAMHDVAMDERGLWWTVLGSEAQRFLNYMLAAGAACTLAGAAGARLNPRPIVWGATGGAAAALFTTGAWARVSDLASENSWALIGAGFAAVLLATAFAGRSRHQEAAPDLGSGLLSAGAAVLLVFSLARLFDGIWLTLAIAALVLVFAVFARVMLVTLQAPIAAALGSLVTLRLFVSRELWLDLKSLPWGDHWPIYGYGVPAALFLVASRLLKAMGHLRSAITLEGLSLGLVISLVALELRVLITGGITYDEPQFLEMAAHILTWLGAAYGLMHRQQLYSSFVATWGARILIGGACAAIVLLSLVTLNPVTTGEPVPGNVVFNALLLAYLAPVILLGLIVRKLGAIGWEALKPAFGLLALLLAFVYITLETKRVYQGHVLQFESLSVAESYAYSAVWLGFALALFVAGLKLARQYVRYAGLGVMVIVVLKVFILDMSSLEGLYRIASFIGLGLCLVGIGWLYQRFVHPPAAAPERKAA